MAGNLTAMIAAAFSGGAAPPVTSDPYYEYTTLLLPGNGTNGAQNNTFLDGSTNNFTITRNGNTTQGTFSPFSQTGWSGYFDGTADFVSTPTGQTNLTLGTSDFTIEGWFYVGTQVQTNPALFTSDPGIGLANTIMIQFTSSTLNASLFVNNVHLTASSTNNYLVSNQWNHIAVCRTGGSTYSYYINGVAVDNVASNSTSLTTNSWRVGYWTVSANAFTGYISNFRIIKGTALYSGATITVPTAPLTAVANTQLLILQSNRFIDNSTNNFTITVNGNTSVVAFSPFNPSASWSAATYGGSGYFDGSGDYLTTATATAFQLGSNDFTIETWVYQTTTATSGLIACRTGATVDGVNIYSQANGTQVAVLFASSSGAWGTSITSSTLTNSLINRWAHVALVRNGTTATLYVDGVSVGSTTVNFSIYQSANRFFVGIDGNGALTGFLSSSRIVNGSAVYTTAFTPPTAPLTAITNTSLLLNFTNAGIYDATSKNDLETVGNAQISNTTAKFGSTSIKFDGTGDYLIMPPSPVLEFGGGDFTIEFWFYSNSISTYQTLIERRSSVTVGGLVISIYLSALSLNVGDANTPGWEVGIASSSLSSSTWYHVACTRSGSSWKMFVNGTQQGSTATWSGTPAFETSALRIAGDVSGANTLNGYMQDIRITKGYARYTANFTAPTAAFPTL